MEKSPKEIQCPSCGWIIKQEEENEADDKERMGERNFEQRSITRP